jgi:hypothetical protein
MDPATHRLITAIHNSGRKCVLAMTGGGTGVAAQLLGIPGGSRTILEILVPYHEQALIQFLGQRPAQFCSAATSRLMANRAYDRAVWLAPGEEVVGMGCTASLATDRPKRGKHRFYITAHTAERISTHALILPKGKRDREAEEAVLDSMFLNVLASASGVPERMPVPLLAEDVAQVEPLPSADFMGSLLRKTFPVFCVEMDGRLAPEAPSPAAIMSGAFNPLHEGHCRLAEVASRLLGESVAFELSVNNVDKPPLAVEEVRRRLQQFTWRAPLWVTRAPTFARKAILFPRVVFVVGADTAERIFAPRYYEDSEARLAQALEQIRHQGCRFLVAGRVDRFGKAIGLEDLYVPEAFRDLFSGIPKADLLVPVSSTALRQQAAQAKPVAAEDETD